MKQYVSLTWSRGPILLLIVLLSLGGGLYAGDTTQSTRDFVQARVALHAESGVVAEVPAKLIDQAAAVLSVLSDAEAVEKQFVALHAPLWAGEPTKEYLQAVEAVHHEIVQKVPAAKESLDRFQVKLQTQYGSRWKTWAKRAAAIVAIVGALVLLRKWLLKRQARMKQARIDGIIEKYGESMHRGANRVARAGLKEKARKQAVLDVITAASYDTLGRRTIAAALWQQYGPATVRRMRAEGEELKRVTRLPADLFDPTKTLQGIPELSADEWKRFRKEAREDDLTARLQERESVRKWIELKERITTALERDFPDGKWMVRGGPAIVAYNSAYGVVKVANPHYDQRQSRFTHGLKEAPTFRTQVRRALNANRIRDLGERRWQTTAPESYLVPLKGYREGAPIADGNHAVVQRFVPKGEQFFFHQNLVGEHLYTAVTGSRDFNGSNHIRKGGRVVCIDCEMLGKPITDIRKFNGQFWPQRGSDDQEMRNPDGEIYGIAALRNQRALSMETGGAYDSFLINKGRHAAQAKKASAALKKKEDAEHRDIQEASKQVSFD